MPELPRDQHDLAAMMALVGDEVGEHVPDVELQVAPRVGTRGRDLPAVLAPELQQPRDRPVALAQGFEKPGAANAAAIHARGNADAVRAAKRSDPHAARVVDVAGE